MKANSGANLNPPWLTDSRGFLDGCWRARNKPLHQNFASQ
jgi:hypothetical protein